MPGHLHVSRGGVFLLGCVLFSWEKAAGLAVGSDHACVLLDDGSLKCFGANDYGQLGYGDTAARGQNASTMSDSLGAVDLGIGAQSEVIAISAGADHTCVIISGGSLKCFGKNDKGQLGLGDTNHRGDEASEMGDNLPAVSLGANRTAVGVAADGDRTCVLLDSGNVRCWGDAQFGGLGSGDEINTGDGDGTIADSVDLGGATVAAIGAGPCAIFEDGSMSCWGKGYYGKNAQGVADNVGDEEGEMGDALGGVALGTDKLAHSSAAGRDYVCAVLEDGGLRCWGRGEGGQLGNGGIATIGDDPSEMGDALVEVDLGVGELAVQVSTGEQHACALLASGGVKCWGRNFYGNLGLESIRARGYAPGTMGSSLPELDLGTGRTALSIAAGGERTCAILDNGVLKCWGGNALGQLGLGDVDPRGLAANQMGDDLPAVGLGTGRTVVALELPSLITEGPTGSPTGVPTGSPTGVPTGSPTRMPTGAPTAMPINVSPAPSSVATPSPVVDVVAATLPPVTPSPSSSRTPSPTPSPTTAAETTSRGVVETLTDASPTIIASVAAPLAVVVLLGCFLCARRNGGAGGAAAAASKKSAGDDESGQGGSADDEEKAAEISPCG